MADSLEDILSDKEPEKPAPEQKPESKQESLPLETEVVKDPVEKQQIERNTSKRKAWQDREQDAQGRVRDPQTGQFLPKEAAKEEPKAEPKAAEPKTEVKVEPKAEVKPPPQELTAKEQAFLKAATDERNKRQELERRLAAIESAKPKEPEKGFWDDPNAALAKHRQEVEQVTVNARLNTAEMIARSRHPDFDEKIVRFQQILERSPDKGGFAQQWLSSPDPAEYAYTVAKNHMEMEQVGNLDGLRAKIEKETEARVRATVEAENKAKDERLRQERAALPGTLSEARGTTGNRAPVWGGPTTLDDILKS